MIPSVTNSTCLRRSKIHCHLCVGANKHNAFLTFVHCYFTFIKGQSYPLSRERKLLQGPAVLLQATHHPNTLRQNIPAYQYHQAIPCCRTREHTVQFDQIEFVAKSNQLKEEEDCLPFVLEVQWVVI